MNNTMKLAEQLLSENKEAIDLDGLIAILTLSIGNEIEEKEWKIV